MQHKNSKSLALASALILALGTTAASAGYSLTTPNATTPIAGGPIRVQVVYTADGATTGRQADIIIDTAKVAYVSATADTASALCSLIGGNSLCSPEKLSPQGGISTGPLCTY